MYAHFLVEILVMNVEPIIGRELARCNVDIAWRGISGGGQRRLHLFLVWAFRARSDELLSALELDLQLRRILSHPKGINPMLMTLRHTLASNRNATFVSDYAPTVRAPEETKENFYEGQNNVIRSVLRNDIFILM